jgi:hypothetical protein
MNSARRPLERSWIIQITLRQVDALFCQFSGGVAVRIAGQRAISSPWAGGGELRRRPPSGRSNHEHEAVPVHHGLRVLLDDRFAVAAGIYAVELIFFRASRIFGLSDCRRPSIATFSAEYSRKTPPVNYQVQDRPQNISR